eukprot:IDg17864t1
MVEDRSAVMGLEENILQVISHLGTWNAPGARPRFPVKRGESSSWLRLPNPGLASLHGGQWEWPVLVEPDEVSLLNRRGDTQVGSAGLELVTTICRCHAANARHLLPVENGLGTVLSETTVLLSPFQTMAAFADERVCPLSLLATSMPVALRHVDAAAHSIYCAAQIAFFGVKFTWAQ